MTATTLLLPASTVGSHGLPGWLWLNPDCGSWETPRWLVQQKRHGLVEGTCIVRRQLTRSA